MSSIPHSGPDSAPSPAQFNALGRQFEGLGKVDQAMEAYRGALLLDPTFRPAAANLGRILVALDRPREAVALLEPLAVVAPDDIALVINYANALLEIGRPAEAEQYLRAVMKTGTVPAQAQNSLGIARYIQRDFAGARDAFSAATNADSSFAEAHENLAQALLHLGDYETAWFENEWRWRNPSNHLTKRIFAEPLWNGQPLNGRTLLLHGEQGYGDTIQFARYASLIDKGNGGRIVLACQEALAPILATVPGVDSVYALGDPLPAFDCQAPILNVRRAMETRIETVPDLTPYIHAEPDAEIAKQSGFKIGIVWCGRARHVDDPYRNRTCPPQCFAMLADIPDVKLFSLQLGRPTDESVAAQAIDLSPRIVNFADTARLVAAMDAVVTIDTALAHLAGALAKPCWVLPPYTADWRWTPRPDGMQPWYPKTRAVPQPSPGDWMSAFARVARELAQNLVDRIP